MKRDIKTLLMGTVALMAGVGFASAHGMRDGPSNANDRGASSGSSSQMTPSASGSHREINGKQGKAEKSEKSEKSGQAQRGPSDTDKDELKSKSSAKPAEKPAEKSTTGQATKDSAKDSAKDKSDS